jgi:hypothetical protein
MEIAIRKFMQITFNAVSNPIFDGVHLIHHIHSTKPTGRSCGKCKALTEGNDRLQRLYFAQIPHFV